MPSYEDVEKTGVVEKELTQVENAVKLLHEATEVSLLTIGDLAKRLEAVLPPIMTNETKGKEPADFVPHANDLYRILVNIKAVNDTMRKIKTSASCN